MSLDGRVAIVTGATSGIGAATALAVAQAGTRVVLAGRRQERLAAVGAMITQAMPTAEWLAVPTDTAQPDQIDHLVAQCLTRFGQLDILISNAGLGMGTGTLAEGNVADWRLMVETNILGMATMAQAALRVMLPRDTGDIVFLTSVNVRRPHANGAVYGATKAAIQTMAEAVRQEIQGTGLRVATVAPGVVATEFASVRNGGDAATADAFYAGQQVLQAEDVARLIVFMVAQPPHVNINDVLILPTNSMR